MLPNRNFYLQFARTHFQSGRIAFLPTVLFFILWLTTVAGISQNIPLKPNITNSKGEREGEWVILFDHQWNETKDNLEAKFYRILTYEHDKPVGVATDHFRLGATQWLGTLFKDRPDVYEGKQSWFYETGQLKSSAVFKNNEVQEGVTYFLQDGTAANQLWRTELYDVAYEAVQRDDHETAVRLFEMCLPHVEAIFERESEEYADLLLWLSIECHQIRRRDRTLHYNLQLVSIYKAIRERTDNDLLGSVFDVGRGYKFLSRWELASQWYKDFLTEEKLLLPTYHAYHGLALTGLGEVLIERGEYRLALEKLKEATSYYKSAPPSEPMELEYLSAVYTRANFLAGHWTEGKKLLLEELAEVEKTYGKKSKVYAFKLSGLGSFYKMNGQLKEAETCLLSAVDINAKAVGVESVFFLSPILTLIEVYCQLGQPQLAEPFVKLGHNHFNLVQDYSESTSLMYVGFLQRSSAYYDLLGKTDLKEKVLDERITFTNSKFGHTSIEYGAAISDLTEHHYRKKKWLLAKNTLKLADGVVASRSISELSAQEIRTLAKIKQQDGVLSVLLSSTSTDQLMRDGEIALNRSLQLYERLTEQRFIPERIDVWLALALVAESRGNLKSADELYLRCLTEVERNFSKDHLNYAMMLFMIAKKAEIRNDHKTSSHFYGQGLGRLNQYVAAVFPYLSIKEKEQFYQSNQEWIENFESYAVTNGEQVPALADQFLNHQLSHKGLVLQSVNRIRYIIQKEGSAEAKALYEEWSDKKNRLVNVLQRQSNASDVDANQLQDEINQLEKKLSFSSQQFGNWSKQVQTSWKDVQAKLKSNEAAIEISYVNRDLYADSVYVATIVRKESVHPKILVIGNAGPLEKRSLVYYGNAVKLQIEDLKSYDAFWKPIANALVGVSKVYFSPDGVYHSINVSTLLNPVTKKFVFEEIDIHVLPTTAQLVSTRGVKNKSRKIALVAHPDYGKSANQKPVKSTDLNRSFDVENIQDLPGTETERLALTQLFERERMPFQQWSESDATETVVKELENPFILHIATHGFFLRNVLPSQDNDSFLGISGNALSDNPLLKSGLLLAGCKNQSWKNNALNLEVEEDGVLTAFEASSLHLDETQLVVLSACETGLGDIENGEGVYGLQRAFVMSGAQQVIMSLWKVDDEATQKFMIAFYSEWLKGKDVSEAFRVAQTSLKIIYPAPYYWGAFVLSGND